MGIDWHNISNSRALRRLGLQGGTGTGDDLPEGEFRIHVQFRRGQTYVYRIPSRDVFDQCLSASSRGRYYVFVIKARWDYVAKY